MTTRRSISTLLAGGLLLCMSVSAALAQTGPTESQSAAVDAYIYGYPLVTMELTRRSFTNVAQPDGKSAPMGYFVNVPKYPPASDKRVTAPNADTLYSTAWIDVGKEPYILHVPDEHGRYYLMPMLDGWTNVFADPGKRTTGTEAADFAITGPGWKGTLPPGIKAEYKSPTNIVWVLGRTYSTGTPADYAAVNAIQAQYKLTPLSAWGKPYTPPPGVVNPAWDTKDPVRDQVDSMDGATYFRLLAELMKTNPPAAADAPMVATMAKIGIVPGQDFDPAKLNQAQSAAVQAAPRPAQAVDHGAVERGRLDQWVERLHQTGRLRHRVSLACSGNRHRPRRQPAAGCDLPDRRDGCGRQALRWRQPLRHALPGGTASAGGRLLVVDDVRRPVFLRAEQAEPLHAERPQRAQAQRRRVGRSLPTGKRPWRSEGGQLAADDAERQVHPDAAALLAEGDTALDPRRHLEAAADPESDRTVGQLLR